MKKKVKLCVLCGKNPATIPDRERMGRPIKRVCNECHTLRLKGDVVKVLEAHYKRG